MRRELTDVGQALTKEYWQEEGYRYLWKQELGSVELLTVEEADSLKESRLLEARVFAKGKELHLFCYENELRAVVTTEEDGDDFFEEKQLLLERFGESITLRHYIDYEDDGQAYIIQTVLQDYEGKEKQHEQFCTV